MVGFLSLLCWCYRAKALDFGREREILGMGFFQNGEMGTCLGGNSGESGKRGISHLEEELQRC